MKHLVRKGASNRIKHLKDFLLTEKLTFFLNKFIKFFPKLKTVFHQIEFFML